MSLVCEEFGCLPTRALWELEHDPDGMALTVIMLRQFARAKAAIDAAGGDVDKMPKGAMADLVVDIEAEFTEEQHQAEIAKRLAALAAEDEAAEE